VRLRAACSLRGPFSFLGCLETRSGISVAFSPVPGPNPSPQCSKSPNSPRHGIRVARYLCHQLPPSKYHYNFGRRSRSLGKGRSGSQGQERISIPCWHIKKAEERKRGLRTRHAVGPRSRGFSEFGRFLSHPRGSTRPRRSSLAPMSLHEKAGESQLCFLFLVRVFLFFSFSL